MEVWAHKGPVKSMSFNETRGLFTCGELDRVVNIFCPLTMNLECIINQKTMKQDPYWKKKQSGLKKKNDDI